MRAFFFVCFIRRCNAYTGYWLYHAADAQKLLHMFCTEVIQRSGVCVCVCVDNNNNTKSAEMVSRLLTS